MAGSRLQYEGQDHSNDIIISGVSDIGNLRNIKNVLLSLQTEFLQGDARVIISGPQKE